MREIQEGGTEIVAIPHRKHAPSTCSLPGRSMCSGCPWDIRLFLTAGAGGLELEEDSSSGIPNAVRCGFKENCSFMSGEQPDRTGEEPHSTTEADKGVWHMWDTRWNIGIQTCYTRLQPGIVAAYPPVTLYRYYIPLLHATLTRLPLSIGCPACNCLQARPNFSQLFADAASLSVDD